MSKVSFAGAAAEAALMPEFVKEYNRITGNNFSFKLPKNGLEALVDKASGFKGFDEQELSRFAAFFYEYVWSTLPDECFVEDTP